MDIILSRFCVLAYVLLFVFVFSARHANRLVGTAHSTGWWRTMPHVASGGGSRAGAGNRDLLGHATGFMQRCWYSLLLLLLLLHKTLPAPLLLPVSHLLEAWVKVVGWQGAAWRVGCILPAGSRRPHHRWRLFRAWQLLWGLWIETHKGLQIQIHNGNANTNTQGIANTNRTGIANTHTATMNSKKRCWEAENDRKGTDNFRFEEVPRESSKFSDYSTLK